VFVPRNRNARAAVLASVHRAASPPYPSRTGAALRRRAVAVVLVLVSLALITVYFRESDSGALHGVQDTGSSVLRPFEVGAERVARPFQDAYGYFADLVHAKSRADRLQRELAALRQQRIANGLAAEQNRDLRRILRYEGRPAFPDGYRAIATEIISQPPSQYDEQVVIGAGTSAGVEKDSPVVDRSGNLVGTVSLVFTRTARVTLVTDESSFVSALDATSRGRDRSRARGMVQHAHGTGNTLALGQVTKDEVVNVGDTIVTAGWRFGQLSSLYPPGIPIGRVTSVGQIDTDLYKRIQVEPFADVSSLSSVVVLVEKGRGGKR
jgi:rod shape-determining protein MreC